MAQELVEPAAMAAAPGEALTPLSVSVLPLAKRKENNGSCMETSPPAMATEAGWCSLPYDLVRRVADCLLDTNDVDCYMDFRAVCHCWRAATDDPKKNTTDARFRPLEWIVLDEGAYQSDDSRVFVNTSTGRFLRKKLPLLRRYYFVATTFGGFFVLADRSPPHAASILNPFTGELVHFAAPVPRGAGVAVFFFAPNSPHNLTLLCDSSRQYYTAVPDSECFVAHERDDMIYNFMRKAVVGGVYTNGGGWASVACNGMLENLFELVETLQVEFVKFFSDGPFRHGNDFRCFLVDFGEEALFITNALGFVEVLEIEPEEQALVPMETIGDYAIFIGHHRCLVVDASKFTSVEANCVYYTLRMGPFGYIWKHKIGSEGTDERVYGAVDFVERNKELVLIAARPSTIIQVLCSYTINLRGSELALQQTT